MVCRPEPLEMELGAEAGLTLMSDLHIGAPQVNYKLIQRELSDASKRNDRILINGDVFDAILSSDRKRFTPDCLHPRLQGRRDILNSAIEWAVDLLKPYAHQIDLIGIGNHESALEKHHSFEPVSVLVYELNRDGGNVHYGGYTGFVDYRIRSFKSRAHSRRWVLYYHHGSGGASPVTKGMIDFNRKDVFVNADCIWMGHKHNRWNASTERISCPESGHHVKMSQVRHVMTGAYFNTYVGQSQQSLREHGRRTNYAADAGLAPQGQGGARVVFRNTYNGLEVRVNQ